MDIQDALRKRLEDRLADEPHVAGKADERHLAREQKIRHRPIVGIAIGVIARVDVNGLDAGIARALQSGRVSAIGDHDRNRRVDAAGGDGVDDRLEIAAAAGDQNGEPREAGRSPFHR